MVQAAEASSIPWTTSFCQLVSYLETFSSEIPMAYERRMFQVTL